MVFSKWWIWSHVSSGLLSGEQKDRHSKKQAWWYCVTSCPAVSGPEHWHPAEPMFSSADLGAWSLKPQEWRAFAARSWEGDICCLCFLGLSCTVTILSLLWSHSQRSWCGRAELAMALSGDLVSSFLLYFFKVRPLSRVAKLKQNGWTVLPKCSPTLKLARIPVIWERGRKNWRQQPLRKL